jgi:hypothetical protein
METALRLAIAAGIAILLPMLVYSGVAAIHAPPDWQDYHQERPVVEPAEPTGNEPSAENAERAKAEAARRMDEENRAFSAAREAFTQVLFFVAVPLGLLALLLGGVVSNPAVAPGLILGGLTTMIVGYMNHWEHTGHALRFATLAVGLLILVAIAWRHLPAAARR